MTLPKFLEELDKKRLDRPAETKLVLERLIPTLSDEREICLALGIYASCERHKGEIAKAIGTLNGALQIATEEWDRAHLLQRRSVAIGATGDFEAAFADSDQALLGYLHSGDFDYMGRTLTDQGMWRFHEERFDLCIQVNQLALKLLAADNGAYKFTCYQGSALASAETRDFRACLEHLKNASPYAEALGHPAHSRFLWTKSRLYARAGRFDLAEEILKQAQDLLWETGEFFDGALSAVALVESFLAQGKVDEATKEGIACRRFLVHLPESCSAVPILATIWEQARAGILSFAYVKSAVDKMESARGRQR